MSSGFGLNTASSRTMEVIETYLAFRVYAAALAAKKKRANERTTSQLTWRRDLRALAEFLAERGWAL